MKTLTSIAVGVTAPINMSLDDIEKNAKEAVRLVASEISDDWHLDGQDETGEHQTFITFMIGVNDDLVDKLEAGSEYSLTHNFVTVKMSRQSLLL